MPFAPILARELWIDDGVVVVEAVAAGECGEDEFASAAAIWSAVGVIATFAASFFVGFEASIVAITALGFLVSIVGLRWPFLGLLGASTLCIVDPLSRVCLMDWEAFRWNTLNYWLIAVAVLSYPRLLAHRGISSRLLILLTLLLGVEIVWAPVWESGVYTILVLVAPWGILAYFVRAQGTKAVWYALAWFSGVVSACASVAYYLHRAALIHVDENAFSYVPLTGLLVICLGLHTAEGSARTFLLALLGALNGVLVFLSGSRGSCLVALLCGLYLLLLMKGAYFRVFVVGASVALAVALVLAFSDLREAAVHRVAVLFDTERSLANRTSGRSDLALAAWDEFLEHPMGVGTGGFAYSSASHQVAAVGDRAKIAHSAWLKVLSENGLPGIALLAAYVGSFAYCGWRTGRTELSRLGLLTTLVLAAGFLSQEFIAKGLWLIAIGATALIQNEVDSDDDVLLSGSTVDESPSRSLRRRGGV